MHSAGKSLVEDTIFASPSGAGTAILLGRPSNVKVQPLSVQREYFHFSVTLSNGPAPGTEPTTSGSAV